MYIKYKDLKKECILIVITIISSIFFFLNISLNTICIYILFSVGITLSVIYDKKRPFDFLFLFLILLSLFHFGQVPLYIFNFPITISNAYDLFNMYSDEEMVYILRYCLIGFNFISVFGFYWKVKGKYNEENKKIEIKDNIKTYIFGKFLFWVLLIPIILFDVTLIFSGMTNGYMARYIYKYPILSNIDSFFPISIICIIAGGNKNRAWKGYYIFALIRIMLQMIFVGNRSALIIYLLLYEFTRNNCQTTKKIKQFYKASYLICIIFICILISFVAIIRGGNRISLSSFFVQYNVVLLFLSEFGSTLITPILAQQYIDIYGIIMGKNYLGSLAILLPLSSRYMENVRSYMNVGAFLNPYSPLKGALGGSLFADMIISFGEYGLIFTLFIGLIVAKICNIFTSNHRKTFYDCLAIYFSYGILLYVRGNAEDLGLAAKRSIYLFIIYLLFCTFINRGKTNEKNNKKYVSINY